MTVQLSKDDKDVFQLIKDRLAGWLEGGTITLSQERNENTIILKYQWNDPFENQELWFTMKFDIFDLESIDVHPAIFVANTFVEKLKDWRISRKKLADKYDEVEKRILRPLEEDLTLRMTLNSQKFETSGYEVRTEKIINPDGDEHVEVNAYTFSGHRIGDPNLAFELITRWGIQPEKADPKDEVCSIGFSQREQAWYGYSENAIWGFRIGQAKFDPQNMIPDGTTFVKLEDFDKIKSLEEAKQSAIEFAKFVAG